MPGDERHGKAEGPIKVLSLPESFQHSANEAIKAVSDTLAQSDSTQIAWRFELPEACLPVVEKVKLLYQEEMSLPEISAHSSHGAVLRRSSYVGRLHNTILVPLIAMDDAEVEAWNTNGKVKVDWTWKKPFFASKLTCLDVECDKVVAGVLVHFPR